MALPELSLPSAYVKLLADQVRGHGAEVGPWLARQGLDEGRLEDPALEVSFEVLRELVADALRVTREPALGLFLGRRLVPNVHGMLGYATLTSASIGQALEITERFVAVRFSLVAVTTEVRGGWVRVRVRERRPLGEIRRPILEAVVSAIKNSVESISMGACRVGPIDFAFPAPPYAPLARELLGCEVRYGRAASGLRLPADWLDAPLRLADPAAFRDAAAILQRELERVEGSVSLAGRVRRVLLEPQHRFPSLQVTARLLRLTPRTLHRRLVDEGTSFRAVLDDVRRTLALEHLGAGRLSAQEIAFLLGYSDLANFRRAFKRWEAVPPSRHPARPRARGR